MSAIETPRALAIKVAQVALPLIGRHRPDLLNPCYKPWDETDRRLDDLQLVRDQLEQEGFEFLGNGAFSVAYAHKDHPGRVLKIAIAPDSAAAEWWAYCARHPGKHKPQVFAVGALGNASLSSRVDFVWMKRYTTGDSDTRYAMTDAFMEFVMRGTCGGDRYRSFCPDERQQLSGIIDVMRAAEQFGSEDLHAGNLMYDPDNDEWIVMDPVY